MGFLTSLDVSGELLDKYGFPTYIVTGILMPSTQHVDLIRKSLHFIAMTLPFLADSYTEEKKTDKDKGDQVKGFVYK